MTIDDRTLAELARELPTRTPDAARRLALRDAIVLEAQSTGAVAAPPRRYWLAAPALAALAAAAYLLWPHASSPAAPTLTASASADFDRTPAPDGDGEVVRLRAGTVALAAAPHQHFHVVASDGSVESSASTFQVQVIDDRIEAVSVTRGRAEIRIGDIDVTLTDGQSWARPSAVAAEAPGSRLQAPGLGVAAPAPIPAPVPAPSPPPPAATPTHHRSPAPAPAPVPSPPSETSEPPSLRTSEPSPSATESAFTAGRAALHADDFATAAADFQRAIDADPTAPLAEDARYWRGVALARAGKSDDARAALTDFLDRFPQSMHAGRADLVLADLLLQAGDRDRARLRLDAARDDADPEVRAAARKALDAL